MKRSIHDRNYYHLRNKNIGNNYENYNILECEKLQRWELFNSEELLTKKKEEVIDVNSTIFNYEKAYSLSSNELEYLVNSNVGNKHTKRKLLIKLLEKAAKNKRTILTKGVVVVSKRGFSFIVYPSDNYHICFNSPFLPECFMRRYNLQRGHEIECFLHPPLEGGTTSFVLKINTVMGKDPESIKDLTTFKELVPYYPTERIFLELKQDLTDNPYYKTMRIIDLISPLGLGQRGIIVAPPRTGKTLLMQGIANSIRINRPDVYLIILLVDERPEEVTDFRRSVKGAEVIASTFDESYENHINVAEIVIEKARRLVEVEKDVVILLDSITRLARAYNMTIPHSGKILSGGIEAGALLMPKMFLGSARNIENGGSLTILSTALIETGSKMDEVIFEEFKGTGNMELYLDRELSKKRIYPAISLDKSGTRKEELLYNKDYFEKVHILRRIINKIPYTDAIGKLIKCVNLTKNNDKLLMSIKDMKLS